MIIGITGTLGAGKGTVVEYLVEKYGFKHYSAREFITREIKKRGLPINRDSMVKVANDLREKYGPEYVIASLYKEAQEDGGDAVIESVRTVGEVEFLKSREDSYLLAVDADPEVRYGRIVKRGSETDHVSYEEFLASEKREMTSSNKGKQNLSTVIARADYTVLNNGSFEELHKQVDALIEKL